MEQSVECGTLLLAAGAGRIPQELQAGKLDDAEGWCGWWQWWAFHPDMHEGTSGMWPGQVDFHD